MSSSSSHQTMSSAELLQRVGDTVARGVTGLATKAEVDEVKTRLSKIESLLMQVLQDRTSAHHAGPDREAPTVPTCGLKVSEDSATNVPSETQTDFITPQRNVNNVHAAHVASVSEEQGPSFPHQPADTSSVSEVPVQPAVIISAPSTAALSSTPIGPSAPPPNEDAASPLAAAPTEEDTLSAEELRRLKPLPQQSTRLCCIREGLRYKTVVGLYCALKSRNPASSSYRTRLSESGMIDMARRSEMRILHSIDLDLMEKTMFPVPADIVNEYSSRRQNMWNNYTYSGNFTVLIREFQLFVRESSRRHRKFTRSQSPQRVGAFVVHARGRAGYRYRPASGSATVSHGADAPSNVPSAGTNQALNHSPTLAHHASVSAEALLPAAWRSSSQFSFPSALTQTSSSTAPSTLAAYSDMLVDTDMALLKEPTLAKPYNIKLAKDLRSDTLIEFYDKLVEANSLVSRLKHDEAFQHALIKAYPVMGTAPFWKHYLPLDTQELIRLTKQIEDDVLGRLLMGVRSKKLEVSHENEYIRLTARYGPRTDAMGLKEFAAKAAKFLDPMEV